MIPVRVHTIILPQNESDINLNFSPTTTQKSSPQGFALLKLISELIIDL